MSRQKTDDSNPHEIIPISYNMREVLHENYYNLGNTTEGKYVVQTRSQNKKYQKFMEKRKNLVLHIKPERIKSMKLPTDIRPPIPKARLGQGRAGIRRKS